MFLFERPTSFRLPACLAAFMLFLLVPIAPTWGQERGNRSSPEALVDAWVVMWNTYDLDEIHRLFLDDDGLTYFSSEAQGVIRGMDAVLEHHKGFDFVPGGDPKGTRLWVENLTVSEFGQAAVLTGIWYFAAAGPEDEPPQRGPVTFVCVRRDGVWSFVHMNFSTYLPEALS